MSKYGNEYILNLPSAKVLLRNTGNFIMNEHKNSYNCGGFALGKVEWYTPYDEYRGGDDCYDIRRDYEDDIISYYECCTQIGRHYVNYMCENEKVREICTSSELRDDEYLVLFRASYDDFHYVRRMDNGMWYHKNGGSAIQHITEDEAYDDNWWIGLPCEYSGDLFMLAVKKPNHKQNRIFNHKIRNYRRRMKQRKPIVYGINF